MFRLLFDPVSLILTVANKLYPGHDVEIYVVDELPQDESSPVYGMTSFPETSGVPVIGISAELPLSSTMEVIAHEIAHVVAGKDADHDEQWEEVFLSLHAEYMRQLELMAADNKDVVMISDVN